jgi:hypothetical protein
MLIHDAYHTCSDDPHSVTQSAFANPCVYLAASDGNPAGFDSGLQSGKQFSLIIINDQERKPNICRHSLLGCDPFARQLSISSAKLGSNVVSEWSGK